MIPEYASLGVISLGALSNFMAVSVYPDGEPNFWGDLYVKLELLIFLVTRCLYLWMTGDLLYLPRFWRPFFFGLLFFACGNILK